MKSVVVGSAVMGMATASLKLGRREALPTTPTTSILSGAPKQRRKEADISLGLSFDRTIALRSGYHLAERLRFTQIII